MSNGSASKPTTELLIPGAFPRRVSWHFFPDTLVNQAIAKTIFHAENNVDTASTRLTETRRRNVTLLTNSPFDRRTSVAKL